MANVTLSIDDQLLERGRAYAAERKSSLNALLRRLLEREIGQQKPDSDEFIRFLQENSGCSDGKKIIREDLHRY